MSQSSPTTAELEKLIEGDLTALLGFLSWLRDDPGLRAVPKHARRAAEYCHGLARCLEEKIGQRWPDANATPSRSQDSVTPQQLIREYLDRLIEEYLNPLLDCPDVIRDARRIEAIATHGYDIAAFVAELVREELRGEVIGFKEMGAA